jgi:hypothetical protein
MSISPYSFFISSKDRTEESDIILEMIDLINHHEPIFKIYYYIGIEL